MKGSVTLALIAAAVIAAPAVNADPVPALVLEFKITLGQVHGRIDHLALDLARQRLYVAELGNDSVGVVDLKNHSLLRTLVGFHEPQGIGYEPTTDTLYVANGADGTVRLFQGADLSPLGQIALGSDADNVRIDPLTHRVLVGYGSGALAVIDPMNRKRIADIRLKAHPESFQFDSAAQRVFVNVPDAQEIAVIDPTTNLQTSSWAPKGLRANFPMTIDEVRQEVLVVFRHPARLGAFSSQNGAMLSAVDTCGDSDDVFIDARRSRVYVSCGEGLIDVLGIQGIGYLKLEQVTTSGGARTSLFVPEMDRLFLAVRANGQESAAIWVFRPAP